MRNESLEENKKLQAEINHRTEVENEAIKLISEGQYEKAMEFLETI
ncbi:MAG: hypothetical protein HDT30_10655 [Clostridiales bacterium]|nr:hypothetical protein [Clostridiales bacterium]